MKAADAVDSCLSTLSHSMQILRQTLDKQQVERSKIIRRSSTATSFKHSPNAAPAQHQHQHHQHQSLLQKGQQPIDNLLSHSSSIPPLMPSVSHKSRTPVNSSTRTSSSQYLSPESNERTISTQSSSSHLGHTLHTESSSSLQSNSSHNSCCGGATQCVSSSGSIVQEPEPRQVITTTPSSSHSSSIRKEEERFSHHKTISAPCFPRPRIEVQSANFDWQNVNIPQLDESRCCLGLMECDSQGNIIIPQSTSL